VKKFIDNTFLKTSLELDISEEELKDKIKVFIKDPYKWVLNVL